MPDRVNLKATDGSSGAYTETIKKINLKPYNKMVITHSDVNTNLSTNILSIRLNDNIIYTSTNKTGWSKKTDEVDIYNYNGEYQIKVQMITGGTAGDHSMFDYNIYEIYLDK